MRTDRIACWIALAAVLIACKKDPETDESDRADPAGAGTAAPAVEEPGAVTGTEPKPGTPGERPRGPGAPANRAEATPGSGPTVPSPSASGTESPTGARPPTAPTTPTAPVRSPETTGPTAATGPNPPEAPGLIQPPAPRPPEPSEMSHPPAPRPPLPDLRLLLTAADVAEAGGGKTEFQRTVLPGVEAGPDHQSLYFEPVKGRNFGFAIQVFREGDGRAARQRWESAFATYPNSVEIAPVAGSSFFAYWGEVLHVGFLQPHGNLVIVVSCGRTYCDSDALYALAKKANSRIR